MPAASKHVVNANCLIAFEYGPGIGHKVEGLLGKPQSKAALILEDEPAGHDTMKEEAFCTGEVHEINFAFEGRREDRPQFEPSLDGQFVVAIWPRRNGDIDITGFSGRTGGEGTEENCEAYIFASSEEADQSFFKCSGICRWHLVQQNTL